MKKYLKDFRVIETTRHSAGTSLIKLTPEDGEMPLMLPGQFVNILVKDCDGVFLRRPISVCDVDYDDNILTLYIKRVGKGTEHLCNAQKGESWNLLLPLGNGFDVEKHDLPSRPLLIGGGVGMAPMLYLGRCLRQKGVNPTFLLGGATEADIPLIDLFATIGETYATTVDGSLGVKGFVTDHTVMGDGGYDHIYCCGPTPMMKAVAAVACKNDVECEVSLENRMACGLGACLCCVEDTDAGHKCVCTDGPVFNVKNLKW